MNEAQQKVQTAIEDLLRLAKRHSIVVCGFAFGGEPAMLTNFGNRTDAGSLALYEGLVKLCESKRSKGEAIAINVGEVN